MADSSVISAAPATEANYTDETLKDKDAGLAEASAVAPEQSEDDAYSNDDGKSSRKMSGSSKLMWSLVLVSLVFALLIDSAIIYGVVKVNAAGVEMGATAKTEAAPLVDSFLLSSSSSSSSSATYAAHSGSGVSGKDAKPYTFFEKLGFLLLQLATPVKQTVDTPINEGSGGIQSHVISSSSSSSSSSFKVTS